MTTLCKLQLAWSGAPVVGGGVTTLYYSGSDSVPDVAAIKSALTAINTVIPSGVSITVPSNGDKIDDTTGSLVGVWSGAGGGVVNGSAGGVVAAGVGACIGWTTGGIVIGKGGLGRRLRGRTYLVPLGAIAYSADGTLDDGVKGNLLALGNALMAAGPLAVWHRPTTKGGSDGNSYAVLSAKVRDKVAFLSSRRD